MKKLQPTLGNCKSINSPHLGSLEGGLEDRMEGRSWKEGPGWEILDGVLEGGSWKVE